MLLVGGVLLLVNDANAKLASPLPYTQFHNAAVSQAALQSLQVEWMAWQKVKHPAPFMLQPTRADMWIA